MSMLLSQVDSLRLMARLVREYDYSEISRMLREAADTILTLRDKAQVSVAERDESYSLGFDNGVKACLQQLEGKIAAHCGIAEIEEWIDAQWREYET